jgi:hypothetical protein
VKSRRVRGGLVIGSCALLLWFGRQPPAGAQVDDCDPLLGCDDAAAEADTAPTTSTAPTVPVAPTTESTGQAGTAGAGARVSPATVAPGQAITIQGDSFAPEERLEISLSTNPPTSLGAVQSDGTGRYSATATIPGTTPLGTYTVTVSGPGPQGSLHEASDTVTVGLAQTGATTGILALAGAVAVGSGVRLVLRSQWSRPVSTRNWAPARRRRWS